MKVDVVVDVGNSGMKWGRCLNGAVAETLVLDLMDTEQWDLCLESWVLKRRCHWAVSGSDLLRLQRITVWIMERNHRVQTLDSYLHLPIQVNVQEPGRVGLDRLCDAVAVNSRRPPGRAAIIIDAGTAVTVDFVDEAGVFQGGAILPGLSLLAEQLNRNTAALPLIKRDELNRLINFVSPPGKCTVDAMAVGIEACFRGGVERVARSYRAKAPDASIYVGGGDGPLLIKNSSLGECQHWPEMTLEGIRIAAEHLPSRDR